jgi:hypothetical protein
MKGRIYFVLGLIVVATMLALPAVGCSPKNGTKTTGVIVETDANGMVTREALVAGQFYNPDVPRISVQKAYELWDSSTTLPAFIDVRPKDLYDMEHVPGARNVPNDPAVTEAANTTDPLFATWKAFPKDRLIILYCD